MAAYVARIALETYAFLILLTLIGVSVSKKVSAPELVLHPAHAIHQGDNVTITCTVRKEKMLNFIRIVRIIGNEPYEVSTNNLIKDPFLETGRYKMIKYNVTGNFTELKLQIKNIQGRDGGNFGCLLLPQDLGAYEQILVRVPPKSVKLTYLRTDGVEQEVGAGGTLQMRQGVESAVTCHVFMDGDDTEPKTGIYFDNKDMTSTFVKDFTADNGADDNGFLLKTYNATYKYLTNSPKPEDNGKQVTCSAEMPHFPPVSAKAKLEILYPPGLICSNKRLFAEPGTIDVKIACKAKMHPAPVKSYWLFGKGPNETRVDSVLEPLGRDEYEMSITIKKVEDEHFTNYHLRVSNGIGDEEVSLVRLVREGTNPPMDAEETLVHGSAMQPTLSPMMLILMMILYAMTTKLQGQ